MPPGHIVEALNEIKDVRPRGIQERRGVKDFPGAKSVTNST